MLPGEGQDKGTVFAVPSVLSKKTNALRPFIAFNHPKMEGREVWVGGEEERGEEKVRGSGWWCGGDLQGG